MQLQIEKFSVLLLWLAVNRVAMTRTRDVGIYSWRKNETSAGPKKHARFQALVNGFLKFVEVPKKPVSTKKRTYE